MTTNKKSTSQSTSLRMPRTTMNNVKNLMLIIKCDDLKVEASSSDRFEAEVDGVSDPDFFKDADLTCGIMDVVKKCDGHNVTVKLPFPRMNDGYLDITGEFKSLRIGEQNKSFVINRVSISCLGNTNFDAWMACPHFEYKGNDGNVCFHGITADASVVITKGDITFDCLKLTNESVNVAFHTFDGDIRLNYGDIDTVEAMNSIKKCDSKSLLYTEIYVSSTKVNYFISTANGCIDITND